MQDAIGGVGLVQIERVLELGQIGIAWQPIVSLPSRTVLGHEALARFEGAGGVSPAEWFEAASDAGLREQMELVALRSALNEMERISSEQFVSLNLSPATAGSVGFLEMLEDHQLDRVVLEIRQSAAVDVTPELRDSIDRLRDKGVRVALDDTGSGLVSMRELLGVDVDIVKLDTDVTRSIDRDVTNQAIAFALVSLAARMGATSLAEGVETEGEAEMLASLGVEAAQGYLFGRPAALV